MSVVWWSDRIKQLLAGNVGFRIVIILEFKIPETDNFAILLYFFLLEQQTYLYIILGANWSGPNRLLQIYFPFPETIPWCCHSSNTEWPVNNAPVASVLSPKYPLGYLILEFLCLVMIFTPFLSPSCPYITNGRYLSF